MEENVEGRKMNYVIKNDKSFKMHGLSAPNSLYFKDFRMQLQL